MKYTITNFSIDNELDITGIDLSYIHIFYCTSDGTEIEMPFIVPFEILFEFIKKEDTKAYLYLVKASLSIRGYGPKHSKLLEIIDSEGFDLTPYIIRLFNRFDEDLFDKQVNMIKEISMLQDQEQVENVIEELDDMVDSDKEYNIKIIDFTNDVDQALHEVTLKYFPEIFEKDSKYIETYREALVDSTLHFAKKIENIINNE